MVDSRTTVGDSRRTVFCCVCMGISVKFKFKNIRKRIGRKGKSAAVRNVQSARCDFRVVLNIDYKGDCTDIGLGCTASGATSVTEDMMLAAAKAVALKLTEDELAQDSILPATNRLRQVSSLLAVCREC